MLFEEMNIPRQLYVNHIDMKTVLVALRILRIQCLQRHCKKFIDSPQYKQRRIITRYVEILELILRMPLV
ncbi:hypothetical protein D3C78_1062730 [compost metagenome]